MFSSSNKKAKQSRKPVKQQPSPEQELLLAGEPDNLVDAVQRIAQDNPELTVQLIKSWLKQDS